MIMVCPACGSEMRRSHTKGIREKLFKLTSNYRVYRCRSCKWRGWLSKPGRHIDLAKTVKTYVYFTIALILTTILALYYVKRYTAAQMIFWFE